MKAIVNETYGSPDVLQLKEVPMPTPKHGEVLVKIIAAAANAADWHLLRPDPFLVRLEMGLFKPNKTILGGDIAGVVEAVGAGVTMFKSGDAVYGDLSGCGMGGYAEYASVPERYLAMKPTNLSFEQASAIPMAGITALQGLRDAGKVQAGQKVLINGASGGVGTFAVQIAKALGAEVTAVCSTGKVEMVRSLGADYVIDYKKEDFTLGSEKYDLIVAANGYHTLWQYRRVLRPHGIYVMIGGTNAQIFQALLLGPLLSMMGRQQFKTVVAKPNRADLDLMRALVEEGKVTPMIDRRYPLSEVAEAIRYLERGHAQGKVVINVAAAG